MITTILFDKDGVFLDSEIINVEAHVFAMRQQGIELTQDDRLDMYGKNGDDGADILSRRYSFNREKYIALKKSHYRENLDTAEIFHEVVKFTKSLKKQNYTLGMVTSMGEYSTEKSLQKLGLEDIFDIVITSDQCTHRKPNAEPYLLAISGLKVNAEECLVFEDSPVGITAAKSAGIKCVAIKSPHVRVEEISHADYVLEDTSLLEKGDIELFLK